MTLSITKPFIDVFDSNGDPYVGAKMYIYESGTTSERAVYSNDGLSVPAANPAISDAAGRFPRLYTASGTYKIRIETSSGALIREEDDLDTGTSAGAGALPITSGGTSATSASGARANLDVPSNSELSALAAQITALANSITNVSAFPQGRLTLTSNTPVLASGVSAATAVYYTLYTGNIVPIYDGAQVNLEEFSELTLTLASQHTAGDIFDVFAINDDGTIRLVTGPAWATATAGSGARGSGGGSTELTRLAGLWVNANAMATARNGSSTYAVAAQQGTYLGSLAIDGTNGQVSCHTAYGQSRKWGVWNAYNRVPIILKAGDGTASWTYTTNTVRASRNDSANSISVFMGLPEEMVRASFAQRLMPTVGAPGTSSILIGWNSTTAGSGKAGTVVGNGNTANTEFDAVAEYVSSPSLGLNTVTALENSAANGSSNTFKGTEANMLLTCAWRG